MHNPFGNIGNVEVIEPNVMLISQKGFEYGQGNSISIETGPIGADNKFQSFLICGIGAKRETIVIDREQAMTIIAFLSTNLIHICD